MWVLWSHLPRSKGPINKFEARRLESPLGLYSSCYYVFLMAWRFLGLGYYVAKDNFTWEVDEYTIIVVKWFEVGLMPFSPKCVS